MKNFYSANSKDNNNYRLLNYIPNLTNKISNNLNKIGCKTINVNKRNLGQILLNNKDKTNVKNKSGVYRVDCNDCDAVYIGQTGRNLDIRIKEHVKSINNLQHSSGLATHCIVNNHKINENSIKLLHRETKGRRLNYIEQLEILKSVKNENNVNDQQGFLNTFFITPIVNSLNPPP